MPTQLYFIPENLPNNNIVINDDDLSNKFLSPIYYIYDLGQYRLDTLIQKRTYQYPLENPNEIVTLEHEGKITITEELDKLILYYDYAKDFENMYDYKNPSSKISKVLIKNKIIAYHYKHKLFILSNGRNANSIANCIKNSIVVSIKNESDNKAEIQKFKKSIIYNTQLNIDDFMKYLVENYNANVKAIYAGNLSQKENKAIAIYGDEADKSKLYEYIKNQGSKLSCVTTKLLLNASTSPKNILFTNSGGIMIFGNLTEELALKIVLECSELIESFLNDETNIK